MKIFAGKITAVIPNEDSSMLACAQLIIEGKDSHWGLVLSRDSCENNANFLTRNQK